MIGDKPKQKSNKNGKTMSTTVLEAPESTTLHSAGPRVEKVAVTPDLAKTWLRKNTKNRPLSQRRIARYASAMSRGEWMFNGDTLRFDKDGNILDGQHRLHAIINSGSEIPQLVVWDLDQEVFVTIDENKPRSAADVLALTGEKYATEIASALRMLHQYLSAPMERIGYGDDSPTNTQILELLEDHPGIRKSMEFSASVYGSRAPVLPKSIITFCHYVFNEVDPDATVRFFERVIIGHGIVEGDPAGKLREAMLRVRSNPHRNITRVAMLALTFKAFNKFRNGETVDRLAWQEREKFPTLD